MAGSYRKRDVLDTVQRLSNRKRFGPDAFGALHFLRPEDIVAAARLARCSNVFPLGLGLDRNGPQAGLCGGRCHRIHSMLATGTGAIARKHDRIPPLNITGVRIDPLAINQEPGEGPR